MKILNYMTTEELYTRRIDIDTAIKRVQDRLYNPAPFGSLPNVRADRSLLSELHKYLSEINAEIASRHH